MNPYPTGSRSASLRKYILLYFRISSLKHFISDNTKNCIYKITIISANIIFLSNCCSQCSDLYFNQDIRVSLRSSDWHILKLKLIKHFRIHAWFSISITILRILEREFVFKVIHKGPILCKSTLSQVIRDDNWIFYNF